MNVQEQVVGLDTIRYWHRGSIDFIYGANFIQGVAFPGPFDKLALADGFERIDIDDAFDRIDLEDDFNRLKL